MAWLSAQYNKHAVCENCPRPPKCYQNSKYHAWIDYGVIINDRGTESRGGDVFCIYFRDEEDYIFWKLKL